MNAEEMVRDDILKQQGMTGKITQDNVYCPQCQSGYVTEDLTLLSEKIYVCLECMAYFTNDEALKPQHEN